AVCADTRPRGAGRDAGGRRRAGRRQLPSDGDRHEGARGLAQCRRREAAVGAEMVRVPARRLHRPSPDATREGGGMSMDVTMFLAVSGVVAWAVLAWHAYKRTRGLLRRLRWAFALHRSSTFRRGY